MTNAPEAVPLLHPLTAEATELAATISLQHLSGRSNAVVCAALATLLASSLAQVDAASAAASLDVVIANVQGMIPIYRAQHAQRTAAPTAHA